MVCKGHMTSRRKIFLVLRSVSQNRVSVNLYHNSLRKSDKDWGSCRHPIFAHLQRGRSTIYIKSNRCEELINTRSLDFESSKSDYRRRNNRGLMFGQIWYFSERIRDYIFNFLDVGANIFHDRMELYDITEYSWKFHLNLTPEFLKSTLACVGFKWKKFVSWPGNSGELKVDAKNPYMLR